MATTITLNPAFKILNGVQQNRFSFFKSVDTEVKEGQFDIVIDSGEPYPSTGIVLDFSQFGFDKVYSCDVTQQDYSTYKAITYVDEAGDYDASNVQTRLIVASNTEEVGGVQSVAIVDGGSGYTDSETATITGQTSASSDAEGTVTTLDGVITAAPINLGGTGYTQDDVLTLTGDTSAANNATGTANVTTGVIDSITITDGGSGYTSAEAITISGGTGTGATATATTADGVVDSIAITTNGSNYVSGETATLTGQTSAAANATGTVISGITDTATFSVRVRGN